MKYDFLNESWLAVVSGLQVGPVTGSQLVRLITAGIIEADTKVSKKDSGKWTSVRESEFKNISTVKSA